MIGKASPVHCPALRSKSPNPGSRSNHQCERVLFTFTNCDGVEPTNNQAERDLRRGVIWRRKSQATRSERGRRFVERMLTVVMTLRAQSRSVYEFLRELLSPDLPTPQLLPDG